MARKFHCGPIIESNAGKIRGFELDGVYHFYGIKYAEAKRWQQPTPVEPWQGVKDALDYGYVSPLLTPNSPRMDLFIPHRFWPESEDCLNLNVWTNTTDRNAKKPVMVWFHGGGYAAGSSIEMVAYDGVNLVVHGDVVVVTVNHRLNIFGYFDLSSYGDKYWNSGNAGNADLVAALQWVHDNIEAFGGDPENVTIFGQSGGGGKVINMYMTPAADKLFARGIMMSGGAGAPWKIERHDRDIAEMLIRQLDVKSIEDLEACPTEDLIYAFRKISPELNEKGWGGIGLWHPVPNDWYLGHPYDVGYTEAASKKPLMVGSVIAEFGAFLGNIPNKDEIPVEERRNILAKQFGQEKADELIRLFKQVYPDKNELILSCMSNRTQLMEFVDHRSKNAEAPVYAYLFAYDFPINGGTPAWHCADIPFAFHNTDKVAICNRDDGSTDRLEAAYSGAYVAFARTGNPNGEGLPEWPAYTENCKATMLFDSYSRAMIDEDTELQKAHLPVATSGFPRRLNVTM